MKKIIFSLLFILVGISIFDCYSTIVILNAGGEEINPVVNFFMNLMGVIPGLLFIKIVVLSSAFYLAFKANKHLDFYAILLLIVNMFYVAMLYVANYQHLKAL